MNTIPFTKYLGLLPELKTIGIVVEEESKTGDALVIATLGEKRTAGYHISISRVILNDGKKIDVVCKAQLPAQGAILAQVVTFPTDAVLVDREYLDYDFCLVLD